MHGSTTTTKNMKICWLLKFLVLWYLECDVMWNLNKHLWRPFFELGLWSLGIKWHDILCDVIWPALFQDNRNTKREQRFSWDSQDQPGDISHSDFSVVIQLYLIYQYETPCSINKESLNAGVAATEGERRKNDKQRLRVEGLYLWWWKRWGCGPRLPRQCWIYINAWRCTVKMAFWHLQHWGIS